VRRLLPVVVALLAAWLGLSQASVASAAGPAGVTSGYSNVGGHSGVVRARPTTEPGPPAATYDYNASPATGGNKPHCVLPHPRESDAWSHTTYGADVQRGPSVHGTWLPSSVGHVEGASRRGPPALLVAALLSNSASFSGFGLTAENAGSVATNLHHSDPMFLGGEPKQALTELTQAGHQALHSDMNTFLRNEMDDFGNHMRRSVGTAGPSSEPTSAATSDSMLWPASTRDPERRIRRAALDFFAQHPGLAP
jgi:hypothetical protein